MKTVYLDKKDRLRAWLTFPRRVAVGAALALLLAFPWAHDSVEGRFVLEPAETAVIRAAVPGTVVAAYAEEGSQLEAGRPVLLLRNSELESQAARSSADLQTATAKAVQAQMRYVDFGPAERERQQLTQRSLLLQQQVAHLRILTPIAGTVLTPRLADRVGSFVNEGTELLQIGNLDEMRARVYVPEHEFRKVKVGATARLHVDSFFDGRQGEVAELEPAAEEIAEGLIPTTQYKGIRPPTFYVATVLIHNPEGALRPGMAGDARILAGRVSLARMAWHGLADFLQRKLW
jgi:multidrug efflux pump subunit AcrA (membrane-fusion protein)